MAAHGNCVGKYDKYCNCVIYSFKNEYNVGMFVEHVNYSCSVNRVRIFKIFYNYWCSLISIRINEIFTNYVFDELFGHRDILDCGEMSRH